MSIELRVVEAALHAERQHALDEVLHALDECVSAIYRASPELAKRLDREALAKHIERFIQVLEQEAGGGS